MHNFGICVLCGWKSEGFIIKEKIYCESCCVRSMEIWLENYEGKGRGINEK